MKKDKLYISTIATNDHELALNYNLGLEIAEYCTAYNMDEHFDEVSKIVEEKMKGINRFTFHAPFNELCPAAIDPKIKEIAYMRYEQAFKLARTYQIKRIIIHSGYVPTVYFKSYFIEQAVEFFKKILQFIDDDTIICLENVMEDEPYMLKEIVEKVNDKRFGLCLDIGHAHVASKIAVTKWLEVDAEYIYHFHIHNNYKKYDAHNGLSKGSINLNKFFKLANTLCADATYTIESIDAKDSIEYLIKKKILED